MSESQSKYYGVSHGNGNDGVSQLFPDYIVKTNEPYLLARLAAISDFKEGAGQVWARDNMEIDGEADYTIYASFHESYETQQERAAMQKRLDAIEDTESDEYSELDQEIEGYGADYTWLIYEVFAWDEDYKSVEDTGRPVYESLDDAFGAELVASERKLEEA